MDHNEHTRQLLELEVRARALRMRRPQAADGPTQPQVANGATVHIPYAPPAAPVTYGAPATAYASPSAYETPATYGAPVKAYAAPSAYAAPATPALPATYGTPMHAYASPDASTAPAFAAPAYTPYPCSRLALSAKAD